MSIYEKEEGRGKALCTLGGLGHAPQEILVFRLSETASGAFQGLCSE